MTLSESHAAFLREHHSAAMITRTRDGVARAVRVGVGLVDDKLWSSGTEARVRTKRLRRDSHCTLFVFDPGWSWLSLETTVRILDGPDAPELNVRLFRLMQGKPTGKLNWFGDEYNEDDFLRLMVEEQRLIYEFEIQRAYGMPG
jgi:Pyridoxamine 5'-phosphate oxidase